MLQIGIALSEGLRHCLKRKVQKGLGCSLVVEQLPGMCEALNLISSQGKNKYSLSINHKQVKRRQEKDSL